MTGEDILEVMTGSMLSPPAKDYEVHPVFHRKSVSRLHKLLCDKRCNSKGLSDICPLQTFPVCLIFVCLQGYLLFPQNQYCNTICIFIPLWDTYDVNKQKYIIYWLWNSNKWFIIISDTFLKSGCIKRVVQKHVAVEFTLYCFKTSVTAFKTDSNLGC